MKHDPETKRESKGKGQCSQLSTTGTLGTRNPDRKESFRKGKPSNVLRFLKMVTVHMGCL